jgi:hypothetical protein
MVEAALPVPAIKEKSFACRSESAKIGKSVLSFLGKIP